MAHIFRNTDVFTDNADNDDLLPSKTSCLLLKQKQMSSSEALYLSSLVLMQQINAGSLFQSTGLEGGYLEQQGAKVSSVSALLCSKHISNSLNLEIKRVEILVLLVHLY